MTREEAITNLNMISIAFVEPVTKEQRKLIDDTFEMAIQALSQEPCDDVVSRKPNCIDCIHKSVCFRLDMRVDSDYAEKCGDFLTELPTVTHKSGKWILLDECANSGYYCSRCQKKLVKEGWSDTVKKIKYCPNCGAKMVEPQESEVNNG